MRQHKFSDATTLAASINDPVARKLIEWMLLRDPDSPADFDRYNAFIQASPDWPSIPPLRRRAEARLWQEQRGVVTVRRFVGERPESVLGRLVVARALLSEGYLEKALSEVRSVWQSAELSAESETEVAEVFPGELSASDDITRMDRRLGEKDFEAAMRAAKRLGVPEVAIVKACDAVQANSTKSETLLEAVPRESRGDLGYALCRLHWLLAHDNVIAAVKLLAESSSGDLQRQRKFARRGQLRAPQIRAGGHDVGGNEIGLAAIAEDRHQIRQRAVERLDDPGKIEQREIGGDLQRAEAVHLFQIICQRLSDQPDDLTDAFDDIDESEKQHQPVYRRALRRRSVAMQRLRVVVHRIGGCRPFSPPDGFCLQPLRAECFSVKISFTLPAKAGDRP